MEKKKIKQLFKYRKLPEMMKFLKRNKRKKVYENLINLQDSIYQLDRYLESKWKLREKKLEKYWAKIYKSLSKFKVDEAEYDKLTSHIKKYQLHESQLRDGLLPTRLSVEYYYYYKSCDVRLMRTLIEKKSPHNKLPQTSDWRLFDLATEINDDITDFKEDHTTINGNYFLIMLYTQSIKETEKVFSEFLAEIVRRSNQKVKTRKDYKIIHEWTLKVTLETQSLLEKTIKKIEKKGLKLKKLELANYLELYVL